VIAMRLAIGDYALLWVLKASDDLGFSTKISFVAAESDDPRDYDCFAPGVWYRRNEFAPDTAIGKDPGCEYFWRMETCYALPLFAMQHIASGETVALSRWAADTRSRMPRSSPPEERAKRNRILDGLLEPVKQNPSAEKRGNHGACIEKMKS